jgi:hypothetical protein
MSETQYDVIEVAPTYAHAIARLWSWSENYDYPSPASFFLDLIGYSDKNYGEPLTNMTDVSRRLGYLELDMLADALKEYTDRPGDAEEYITRLITATA